MLKTNDVERKKIIRRFRSLEMEYKGKKCVVLAQADGFSDNWVVMSEDQAYYIVSGKELSPTAKRLTFCAVGKVADRHIIRSRGDPLDIDFIMGLFEGRKIKITIMELK